MPSSSSSSSSGMNSKHIFVELYSKKSVFIFFPSFSKQIAMVLQWVGYFFSPSSSPSSFFFPLIFSRHMTHPKKNTVIIGTQSSRNKKKNKKINHNETEIIFHSKKMNSEPKKKFFFLAVHVFHFHFMDDVIYHDLLYLYHNLYSVFLCLGDSI